MKRESVQARWYEETDIYAATDIARLGFGAADEEALAIVDAASGATGWERIGDS